MKIGRFMGPSGPELGLIGNGITSIARRLPDAPSEMNDLIASWSRWKADLEKIADDIADYDLESAHLLAPVPQPRKIMGIGLNYADHAAESGLEKPDTQLWFSKPGTAVAGPADPIFRPRVSSQLDYEAELVVVIGKPCRYADADAARDAIFGYCAGNDVSVRDWQFRTSQFILGKSFDSHAPHGPWIVTADVIDPLNLDISCSVNGELRQQSNTRHLIHNPVEQVQYLSQVMTLLPGDLLFTGTPSGVGFAMKPQVWLEPGDRVEVTIEHIGSLNNRVVQE